MTDRYISVHICVFYVCVSYQTFLMYFLKYYIICIISYNLYNFKYQLKKIRIGVSVKTDEKSSIWVLKNPSGWIPTPDWSGGVSLTQPQLLQQAPEGGPLLQDSQQIGRLHALQTHPPVDVDLMVEADVDETRAVTAPLTCVLPWKHIIIIYYNIEVIITNNIYRLL